MSFKDLFQINEPLDVLLKDKYPEILKAIRDEGYNLEFQNYDVFEEITFENKVVGFITLESIPPSVNHFWIMDAYVIPEYRGNNLFFDFFSNFLLFDNYEFYPRKPTKAFINVLLKNDCAFKLTSDIVVSYFKFMVDVNHDIYKNPKIKRFYKNPPMLLPYKAHLFDMNLCSIMLKDPELFFIKYANFFALTEPRKYDLKRYKCRKKLKRVSESYIDDRFEAWELNFWKIEEFIQRKDDEFAEELLIENVIGSKDKLRDDFIGRLEESNLTIEDGFKIRNHIVDKLDSGELNEKSYIQRVFYLLNSFEDIDKEIDDFDEESIEICPFCGDEVSDNLRSCVKCGLHLREIDFEEHAIGELHNMLEDIRENIKNFDFDKFLGHVPIDDKDDDELKEFKKFFNGHMAGYDFDEFLEFYNSHKENHSIEEVMDLLLEENLNKALGTENEFDEYSQYLIQYSFYNSDIGKYDDAFIKLAQLSILASNKSKDKNNILSSNPKAFDIWFIIETLVNADYSGDISKLFKEAINTFKIDKYNKNHDEVLKDLKEIFNYDT